MNVVVEQANAIGGLNRCRRSARHIPFLRGLRNSELISEAKQAPEVQSLNGVLSFLHADALVCKKLRQIFTTHCMCGCIGQPVNRS